MTDYMTDKKNKPTTEQKTTELQSTLTHQKCVPCEGSEAPLTNAQEDMYYDAVEQWQLVRTGTHQLVRDLSLKNFSQALELVAAIGQLAENEGHHPNIYLHDFKKVRIELYTHAIGGLSMNDFIMAAKIDVILEKSV